MPICEAFTARVAQSGTMKMAETLALRNERALLRFNKALPDVFPAPVLTHAMARRWTPPTPRLAIDSYWRMHPLRADRLARALAAKSGAPAGWTWRLKSEAEPDLPSELSSATRPLSRGVVLARAGPLRDLRTARLSARLARRPLGQGAEQQRGVAHRLRCRVAIVERAERSRQAAAEAAGPALRDQRRAGC